MKRIAVFILLLSGCVCEAQNYQTVYSGREAFYRYVPAGANSIPVYYSITGVRPDSAMLVGADSVLYHYRTAFDTLGTPQNSGTCSGLTFAYPTFQGIKTVIRAGGDNIFFNIAGDSIHVKTQATTGQSWTVYTFPGGDKVVAIVSAQQFQSLNTFSDSIKILQLSVKDALGNPVTHIMNNVQLELSKNSGWFTTLDWRNFPNDTTLYTIEPAKRLTYFDIYDFNVGDEFHRTIMGGGPAPHHKYTILSKSSGSNSLSYTVLDVDDVAVATGSWPPYQWTSNTSQVTWTYNNVNNYVFNGMPDEAEADAFPCYMSLCSDTTCGRHYSIDAGCMAGQFSHDSCYNYAMEGTCVKTTYIEHEGSYFYQDYSALNGGYLMYEVLSFYYNAAKGAGCGNAYTYSVQENHSIAFNLYPNPVSTTLTIELPVSPEKVKLRVTDVLGRSVSLPIISSAGGKLIVATETLPKGVYSITLCADNSYSAIFVKE